MININIGEVITIKVKASEAIGNFESTFIVTSITRTSSSYKLFNINGDKLEVLSLMDNEGLVVYYNKHFNRRYFSTLNDFKTYINGELIDLPELIEDFNED